MPATAPRSPAAAIDPLERRDDGVLRRRPESIRPRRVDEVAEHPLDVPLEPAMGRHLEHLRCPADRDLEVREQGDPKPGRERRRAVVRDVCDDAADPLVDQPYRRRGEDPAEVVVGGLRAAAMVDDAIAGAGDEVAQPQDHAAADGEPARRHSPKTWAITSPVTARESSR